MIKSIKINSKGRNQAKKALIHISNPRAVVGVLVPEAPGAHSHALASVLADNHLY